MKQESLNLSINSGQPTPTENIKFDMREEESARSLARKGHEFLKILREVGLRNININPAINDAGARKLFRLPTNTKLSFVEIELGKRNESEIDEYIQEIKEQLLNIVDIKIIDEKFYNYDSATKVYRILVDIKL